MGAAALLGIVGDVPEVWSPLNLLGVVPALWASDMLGRSAVYVPVLLFMAAFVAWCPSVWRSDQIVPVRSLVLLGIALCLSIANVVFEREYGLEYQGAVYVNAVTGVSVVCWVCVVGLALLARRRPSVARNLWFHVALFSWLGWYAVPYLGELLALASVAQSAFLLGLAAWSGVALAASVGLRAPTFEAAVTGRPVAPTLRPQVLPGLVAGVLGGLGLSALWQVAPPALAAAQMELALPLAARVLYGGITEELLLRWGLMTALVWLAWRVLQRRQGVVRAGFVWLAIAVSALVFAAGHLPAAAALLGSLDAPVVAFVLGANTAFGLLFGYLYWRYGLEAAIIAHALTHVVYVLDLWR